MAPAEYLESGYYEHWLYSLENVVQGKWVAPRTRKLTIECETLSKGDA